MAVELIEPTDIIEVSFVPFLIFGPPGTGKSTLAQTADRPLTLDFDKGIHRVSNRKNALRFGTWADSVAAGGTKGEYRYPHGHKLAGELVEYQTLIIDTGGRALDTMIPQIIGENAKNGYAGNLSQQGWGVLGSRFTTWMKTVASWGKEVVMLCHQEEARNAAQESYFLPDMPGKMSYKEMHKLFDVIGRFRYEGKARLLDFSPSDNSIGKNPAGWEPIHVPELHAAPTFLADLIAECKAKLGKTAEASAKAAQAVQDWRSFLASDPTLDALNARLPQLSDLKNGTKAQAWFLVQEFAKGGALIFDPKARRFNRPAPKPEPAPQLEAASSCPPEPDETPFGGESPTTHGDAA